MTAKLTWQGRILAVQPLYKARPTRKVPGRQGMTWEEADWIDDDATSHRDVDA